MTAEHINAAAERLAGAEHSRIPCAPVRELIGETDIVAAYGVAKINIDRKIAQGRRRVGRKIGLTSVAVQQQLGVDQPDFGSLLDDMVVVPGGLVPAGVLIQPKVEAEVAFIIARDLTGKLETIEDVRDAIAGSAAAIEIVDSRVTNWDIRITDTVADNASSGMFVVSDTLVPLADVEPVDVTMTMTVNGEEKSSGNGAACLGNPLTALLWLAQKAQELGDPIRKGEIVLSGALGPMAVVQPGDRVSAAISGLGRIDVGFAAS